MCSLGRDQTTSIGAMSPGSIGAVAPSSTLMGNTALGGNTATGATRVARGAPTGTLLTGGSPPPTRKLPPKMQEL